MPRIENEKKKMEIKIVTKNISVFKCYLTWNSFRLHHFKENTKKKIKNITLNIIDQSLDYNNLISDYNKPLYGL